MVPSLLAGQMIGAAASAIPSIVAGVNQLTEARKQKKRAEEIEKEADNVLTRPIPKLYKTAQEQREIDALAGMPTYEATKQDIEAQTANTLRSIRESSPMGATAAAAIASVLGQQNKNLMGLQGQQGQFKFAGRQAATEGMQGLGDIQERLEAEKRQEQARLRAASEALLQASTANKQTAIETIGGSLAPFGKYIGQAASGGFDNATLTSMTPPTSGGGDMSAIIKSYLNSLPADKKAEFLKGISG